MRTIAAALSLLAILAVALIAQAVFHSAVAAWIAIGVTVVVCAAVTFGMLPTETGNDE